MGRLAMEGVMGWGGWAGWRRRGCPPAAAPAARPRPERRGWAPAALSRAAAALHPPPARPGPIRLPRRRRGGPGGSAAPDPRAARLEICVGRRISRGCGAAQGSLHPKMHRGGWHHPHSGLSATVTASP